MSDLVAWCLSVFGFTYIVVFSKICRPVRDFVENKSEKLGELFHCPLCLGFWVGLLAHFMCGSPTQNILFDMTLASICSWIGTILIDPLADRYESS